MDFMEELRSIVAEGMEARENFDPQWSSISTTVILKQFQLASTALSECPPCVGKSTINPDQSVELSVDYLNYNYTLKFVPDKERLEVVCTSNIKGETEERLTIDLLTRAEVETKIKNFARLLSRGVPASRRPLGWNRS